MERSSEQVNELNHEGSDWGGISSGEDDGEATELKGSDTDFIHADLSRAQEGDEEAVSVCPSFGDCNVHVWNTKALRRSPRRHERTVLTDFVSGWKSKEDLTVCCSSTCVMRLCSVKGQFDQRVQIATKLSNIPTDKLRQNVKNRLAELLTDSNITLVSPVSRR